MLQNEAAEMPESILEGVHDTAGNPLSHAALRRSMPRDRNNSSTDDSLASTSSGIGSSGRSHNDNSIHYVEEYRRRFNAADVSSSEDEVDADEPMETVEEYDEMENSVPRYLIFSTGSKTYTPHQIGIKRIRHVTFPKKLDPGPSLRERIAARKAEKQNQLRDPDPDWWNYEAVADRFDKVDKVIDLHGHIIGMALSPDHR